MNNGIIAIIDPEEEYAIKLADYFRIKSGLNYNVQVFSNIYTFLEFELSNYVDILIIAEVYGDFISGMKNTGQVYILSEGTVDISLKEYSSVYKYQSSENIIRDVMTNYANLASPRRRINVKTATANIISVYSPIKRCGKTTFSLVMGCIMSRHESTLYISLEEYSCLSFFTGEECAYDLSDLLYFYRQSPSNLDRKLVSLSHSFNRLDYIPPMRFSSDIKHMTGSDWCTFFDDIATLGKYQNIILDLSDSIIDIYDILSISSIIYFPILDDPLSQEKICNFKSVMARLGKNQLSERIQEIPLPVPDSSDFGRESFSSLLYGNYGSAVEKLINKYE